MVIRLASKRTVQLCESSRTFSSSEASIILVKWKSRHSYLRKEFAAQVALEGSVGEVSDTCDQKTSELLTLFSGEWSGHVS